MRFEGDMEGILAVGLRGQSLFPPWHRSRRAAFFPGGEGEAAPAFPAKTPQAGAQASVLILEKPKVPRTRS
jgi:hypothetical protein